MYIMAYAAMDSMVWCDFIRLTNADQPYKLYYQAVFLTQVSYESSNSSGCFVNKPTDLEKVIYI